MPRLNMILGEVPMIYLALCDDEERSLAVLKKRVDALLREHGIHAEITGYSQSRLLQYEIEEGKHFDLVLSDIEMPCIDGMQLAEYIKKHLPEALIIFITSHMKYVIDAFELSIFRYVPKNSMDSRFSHALLDAVKMIETRSDQTYCIDMPTRMEKIPYRKIRYIERDGKNSVINLTDGSAAKVRKSLSNVSKELDSEDFVFIDRGSIVNIQHIMKIINGCVELEGGVRLFASRARLDELKKRVSAFWGERI